MELPHRQRLILRLLHNLPFSRPFVIDAAKAEGNALLTALSCGMGLPGEVFSENEGKKIDEANGTFQRTVTDEARKQAIKEVMAQICRERDEYEAEKTRKKAEEEAKAAAEQKEE